jgi:hypothetical protein
MKKYTVIFTNGNATSIIASSKNSAKRQTQGTPDEFGNPRRVKEIRPTRWHLEDADRMPWPADYVPVKYADALRRRA